MSDEVVRPSTGIPELDNIVKDDVGLSIEPMPIDKRVFDNTLLPLLRNEVDITSDESFDHIRNIWINYYNNYSKGRLLLYKDSSGVVPKSMSGNAVFTPMVIKDIAGVVIATTPPLIEPMMIVGMNEVLEAYSSEMKHNPNLAKVKLINSIKQYSIGSSQGWINFLTSYGADMEIVNDDNDDLIIRS